MDVVGEGQPPGGPGEEPYDKDPAAPADHGGHGAEGPHGEGQVVAGGEGGEVEVAAAVLLRPVVHQLVRAVQRG